MPAPAVIPAPIAYINAAAVKKLVVGSRVQVAKWPFISFKRVLRLFVGWELPFAFRSELY